MSGAAGTTKRPNTTKPSAPTTQLKTKPVAAQKSRKVVQPGTGLEGWSQRGSTDWPAADSALIAEPLNDSILVRKSPDFSTPGIVLSSGGSVSGELGLLVVGESNGWWKVMMPVRPNGTIGWVQASSVKTHTIRERVTINLATNRLTLWVDGKVASEEDVATGTSGTPTPNGLFFVKSIVPQENPAGGRGPFVLVLSAFSNVLNSFDGGQGAVGIHGTSAPGKLGQDVSHGCVRVKNDTIIAFAKKLIPGTPVEVYRTSADAPKTRWSTPASVSNTGNVTNAVAAATTTKANSGAGPNAGTTISKPATTVEADSPGATVRSTTSPTIPFETPSAPVIETG
jgi:L,D-transpeptidase catalytic domain